MQTAEQDTNNTIKTLLFMITTGSHFKFLFDFILHAPQIKVIVLIEVIVSLSALVQLSYLIKYISRIYKTL